MPYDNAAYTKKWKAENKDRVRASQKAWRQKNAQHLKEYEKNRHDRAVAFGLPHAKRSINQYWSDPEKARNRQYAYKYGMTAEQIEAFDKTTKCSLCKAEVPHRQKGKRHSLHIDHDHKTGRVRGFLCNRCNTGLGKLGDTEEGLLRALEYIRASN